jgi:GNAT superfamily N-acetyltransferase
MRDFPAVRGATSDDIAGVRACVLAAFEHYVERIGHPPASMLLDFDAEIAADHVWVVTNLEAVLGVIVQYETSLGFYIDTLAVLPSSQGTGVGRALLEFAECEAMGRGHESVYLCTNSRMTENQVLYPHIGYVEYDRRHESGYDRVFYRKQLVRPGQSAA